MDKSNVLLSQSEIDALLDFLAETKVSSATMDQESIDRLIGFLQSNEGQNFNPQALARAAENKDASIIVLPGNENITLPGSFRLSVNTLSDGNLELICTSTISEKSYKITPNNVEQVRYFEDSTSCWGFAIAPSFFDRIAKLLSAKYTKATYEMVCKTFAKSCYGNENTNLPALYIPSKNSIIENMIG